jgi:uncharacterized membrane protein YdjX (TVP38/TMEM64 family)
MKRHFLSFVASRMFRKGLLVLLLSGLLGLMLSSHSMFESLNREWIDLYIRNNGLQGMLYYALVGALVTAMGCPRQLVALLGGYAFGFVDGSVFSTLSVGLGCVLSFFLARLAIRPLIVSLYASRVDRVDQFLSARPFFKTIVIRMLPVGNNLITNLVAGVTRIKARHFFLGSLVGYYPQMAIFSMMGKGVVVLSIWKISLSILLFFVSGGIGLWLYREFRASRLEPAPETPEPDSIDEPRSG